MLSDRQECKECTGPTASYSITCFLSNDRGGDDAAKDGGSNVYGDNKPRFNPFRLLQVGVTIMVTLAYFDFLSFVRGTLAIWATF